jgi:hypothetical protein
MDTTVEADPTEELVAAVVAAIEVWSPRPTVEPADTRRPSVWKFSGRWWSQPIPLRRPRPWH